jgi:hypothetical protein
MENTNKIIVSRPNQWLNRTRIVKVFIDDKEAGSVKNGSSEEFAIGSGQHIVQCKMDWQSSPVMIVNLNQHEIEYLIVKNAMKYYWPLFLLMLIGVGINLFYLRYQTQRPLGASLLQLALILPALIYLLYYITIGRKKYLILEADQENIFAS